MQTCNMETSVENTELAVDKLSEFFNEKRDFLAVHRPAGSLDILRINGRPTDRIIKQGIGKVKISYSGRFSEEEKKILRILDLWIAENNFAGSKKDLRTMAVIPLTGLMKILGKTTSEVNRRKYKQRLMGVMGVTKGSYENRGILKNLSDAFIEIDDGQGTRLHTELGTGTFSVSIPKDVIRFEISTAYVAFQNTAPLGQYNRKTLSLTGLAFIIADKVQDQYFRDGNRSRQTNDILSIEKITGFCSEYIPSYSAVQERDRGHWKSRIRDPVERALNQIQEKGLFNWKYCGKKKMQVPDLVSKVDDYDSWVALYITYTLIPDEPDMDGRLKRKTVRSVNECNQQYWTEAGLQRKKRDNPSRSL